MTYDFTLFTKGLVTCAYPVFALQFWVVSLYQSSSVPRPIAMGPRVLLLLTLATAGALTVWAVPAMPVTPKTPGARPSLRLPSAKLRRSTGTALLL